MKGLVPHVDRSPRRDEGDEASAQPLFESRCHSDPLSEKVDKSKPASMAASPAIITLNPRFSLISLPKKRSSLAVSSQRWPPSPAIAPPKIRITASQINRLLIAGFLNNVY